MGTRPQYNMNLTLGDSFFANSQTLGEKAYHPEPFASLKGKLREGSGSTDAEILRCAQSLPLSKAKG